MNSVRARQQLYVPGLRFFWHTERGVGLPLKGLKRFKLKEKDIELQCGHWLKSKRIFFWKTIQVGYFDPKLKRFRRQQSPFVINGVADFLAVINGRLIALEIKSEEGRQSEDQKQFEAALKLHGADYYIIRSTQDLDRIFIQSSKL